MTTLLDRSTRGVYSIAPTPFEEDGRIDFDSLSRLLDYYEEVGVDGVTVLGQLGEAAKLTHGESLDIVNHVLARTKLPVVVGISGSGFASMGELAERSMEAGAAGVMIAPLPTLRSDEQIAGYYAQCAAVIGSTPFVLQDYPLRFSVQISAKLVAELAQRHENLVMLKHEDWPGLDKISALRGYETEGRMPRLSILCGNGGLFLDYEMARGADGAMSGYCFQELFVDVVRLHREDRSEEAHDLFDAHLPLVRYEQQPGVGLAVRKHIFLRRGLISSDYLREPRPKLTKETVLEVDHLLRRLARLDPRAATS